MLTIEEFENEFEKLCDITSNYSLIDQDLLDWFDATIFYPDDLSFNTSINYERFVNYIILRDRPKKLKNIMMNLCPERFVKKEEPKPEVKFVEPILEKSKKNQLIDFELIIEYEDDLFSYL
jgi:hypothetical protein